MTTAAVSGYGSIITWDSADLAEINSISGPNESASSIDVTSHDSTDGYEEFIAGLRSGGDISIEGNFISGDTLGQIAAHTDFQAGSTKVWILKHPSWVETSHEYPQATGSGFITAFNMGFPVNDKIPISITIKVTGKPTLKASA